MISFFARINRLKYIVRWGLMRNTRPENNAEHSHQTAVLAHALCLIRNRLYGGHLDAERAATLALFHDIPEIITGDMPTPIKHGNPELHRAFRAVEESAARQITGSLPEELREEYVGLLSGGEDPELKKIVKAADRLSAYLKCVEERQAGNTEFRSAEAAVRQSLEETAKEMPELRWFLDHCTEAFEMTLDELE